MIGLILVRFLTKMKTFRETCVAYELFLKNLFKRAYIPELLPFSLRWGEGRYVDFCQSEGVRVYNPTNLKKAKKKLTPKWCGSEQASFFVLFSAGHIKQKQQRS